MVKSFAKRITSFLICNKVIETEEYDLYVYGFETLVAFIVNILVILGIGSMFNKLSQTALFLVCYCPIRQFAGGYHADNYRRCLLVFILIFLINLYILNNLVYGEFNNYILGITCISYVGIWSLAPLEHRNNPLSKKEKRCYKKVVRYLISISLIFVIISINFKTTYEYAKYVASVIIWIFIMLNLGIIKNTGGIKI